MKVTVSKQNQPGVESVIIEFATKQSMKQSIASPTAKVQRSPCLTSYGAY